ncbi:MAG: EVE domain-containing protein [Gemmataceae bacterium]|nr:EVE domain-containing protein [Gemmataceae bacterium]
MALWLFKQEPGCYPYSQLEKEGKTEWDGVRNNLALQNLRKIAPGDLAFFYHTGKEKSIIGVMCITKVAKMNPRFPAVNIPLVEVIPVRSLAKPVTLGQIKAKKALATWELLRLPRLSVVPVSSHQWKLIEEMSLEANEYFGNG